MVKPIGAICNLDCTYCYYLHKKELLGGPSKFQMSDEILETHIRQCIQDRTTPNGIPTGEFDAAVLCEPGAAGRNGALGHGHADCLPVPQVIEREKKLLEQKLEQMEQQEQQQPRA